MTTPLAVPIPTPPTGPRTGYGSDTAASSTPPVRSAIGPAPVTLVHAVSSPPRTPHPLTTSVTEAGAVLTHGGDSSWGETRMIDARIGRLNPGTVGIDAHMERGCQSRKVGNGSGSRVHKRLEWGAGVQHPRPTRDTVSPLRLLTIGEISGRRKRAVPNGPSLPKRNRRYVIEELRGTYLRITEDGVITSYEVIELSDVITGTCQFAVAIDTEHSVSQALPRATDPEYVGDLVALHQAAMRVLPDAREAA